jgi:homoserine O-acetyltransferase
MQALEWALRYPELVERSIVIGTAPLQALGLSLNHLQRQAIWNDPGFQNGWYDDQPGNGLGAARAIAMLSYKSGELFEERYGRRPNRTGNEDPFTTVRGRFDVAGYLDYQQSIFLKRFDANTYITITKLMDTWDVPREGALEYRGVAKHGVEIDLVGISSDWLFPPADVQRLHQRLTREGILSRYSELNSKHGHDAFLAEPEQLFPILRAALASRKALSKAANGYVHANCAD